MLSLDRKEAKVYLLFLVVIRMAFGITNAVIFFSKVMISCMGIANYMRERVTDAINERVLIRVASRTRDRGETHVGDPTEDVGVEAHVVFGNIESPLDEDVPLQCATIICKEHGTTFQIISSY